MRHFLLNDLTLSLILPTVLVISSMFVWTDFSPEAKDLDVAAAVAAEEKFNPQGFSLLLRFCGAKNVLALAAAADAAATGFGLDLSEEEDELAEAVEGAVVTVIVVAIFSFFSKICYENTS